MAMCFKVILFYGSAFVFSLILGISIVLIATSKVYPVIFRSKKEKCFIDPRSGKYIPFPSIDDKATVNLSIIIPAYNEEVRLPPMLEECIDFLENRKKSLNFQYEIIVVSDGSTDGTAKIANHYCKRMGTDKFRVLDLESNRGKGGAVRLGIQSSRGSLLLFADADGATKFADITKLEDSLVILLTCGGAPEIVI